MLLMLLIVSPKLHTMLADQVYQLHLPSQGSQPVVFPHGWHVNLHERIHQIRRIVVDSIVKSIIKKKQHIHPTGYMRFD